MKFYYDYDEVDKVWSIWETSSEFGDHYGDYDVHQFDCVTKNDAEIATELLNSLTKSV